MDTQIIAAFVIYISILMTIGFFAYRQNTTEADFMVGGRKLNYWVTALSANASDMSSWLFMSFPMAIFTKGFPQIWIGFSLTLGMFLNWHFIAPKLRQATEDYNNFTLTSFLESRFKDNSGTLRLLGSIATILFMMHYVAAGLISLGFFFDSLFGINYHVGISIATAVVVSYTFLGGFVAIAWTDFFQAVFLLAMILLVPAVAFTHIDGIQSIVDNAAKNNISLSIFPASFDDGLSLFLTCLAWGLGYFGMPHILIKFLGISEVKELRKSKILGISWQIVTLGAAAAIGLVGIAYFSEGLSNNELVFVHMVQELFPPFIGGFILCGVLAAAISTMDSQILVVTSVFAEDIYKATFRRSASSSEVIKISRGCVILFSIIALSIASTGDKTIYDTVFYAWQGLGCAFGPIMILSFYSKTINRAGAITAVVCGTFLGLTWDALANFLEFSRTIPALIPGFFITILLALLVSRWTSPKQQAV